MFSANLPRPTQVDGQRNISNIYDNAIHWLANHHHPQQRRQLLHTHQQKLAKFYQESNLAWDAGSYVTTRYSHSRPESLFATPEIQRNIDAANSADGGNVPSGTNGTQQDKLSMNELQLHLANQAARLRMDMTDEYEELRKFQNSELGYWLKAKAKSEPDFKNEVERARIPPMENVKIPRAPPPRPQQSTSQNRPPPLQRIDSTSNNYPAVHSPVVQMFSSPREPLLDPSSLKNDSSLDPEKRQFVNFILDLQVVQHNWAAISPHWSQYVDIFKRNLMTKNAFAKAILEDAVRNDTKKYEVDPQRIESTRNAIALLPDASNMTRIITQVVLELAEAGIIELDTTAAHLKGPAFGPNLLNNVIVLDTARMAQQKSENPVPGRPETTTVKKATDPRQRR
jgi:hypothetical protein